MLDSAAQMVNVMRGAPRSTDRWRYHPQRRSWSAAYFAWRSLILKRKLFAKPGWLKIQISKALLSFFLVKVWAAGRSKVLLRYSHVTIGAMLCALTVKMTAWSRKLSNKDTGGATRRSEFAVSKMKRGIDILKRIEAQATNIQKIDWAV